MFTGTTTIIETISTEDLGSFAITKEYSITGAGVQDINSPINTINIVSMQQERYQELSGAEVIKVAEDFIRSDVATLFNGPFAVYVTGITLLTGNSENKEVFVSCTATTVLKKIVDYRCYSINPDLSWADNMTDITNSIYNRLYAEMSLQVSHIDMESFGITYHCFNPI